MKNNLNYFNNADVLTVICGWFLSGWPFSPLLKRSQPSEYVMVVL